MTINVFGNSSNNSDNKIDTSKFVQKSYLRSNYIETDIDHDINLKNQYRIINSLQPINDNGIVNKIYIDNKIADMIKKNIQNDDYISFLDNANKEYKLEKYRSKITLSNVSLFNNASGADCNSLWCYYTQSGNLNQVISGRDTITPMSWRTGLGLLYEGLSYLSFNTYFLTGNTYAEISRFDIYNIIKIQIIINRFSLDDIMGEFSVFYKNSDDEWIEIYKIEENVNINGREEWEILTIAISENNYGIKIRHNKKNFNNQMCSITKIILTHKI